MFKSKVLLRWLAMGWMVVLTSCHGASDSTTAIHQLAVPSRFVEQGITWEKQSMPTYLESQLSHFLQENSQYTDHPAFHSEPTAFRSTNGDWRIYWIPGYGEEPFWLCYSNQSGGSIVEGQGDPFVSSKEVVEITTN